MTWCLRRYHLFFTFFWQISHWSSLPTVCIFSICCKKVRYISCYPIDKLKSLKVAIRWNINFTVAKTTLESLIPVCHSVIKPLWPKIQRLRFIWYLFCIYQCLLCLLAVIPISYLICFWQLLRLFGLFKFWKDGDEGGSEGGDGKGGMIHFKLFERFVSWQTDIDDCGVAFATEKHEIFPDLLQVELVAEHPLTVLTHPRLPRLPWGPQQCCHLVWTQQSCHLICCTWTVHGLKITTWLMRPWFSVAKAT